MKLYDPARRRINDRPELLGRRVVVPKLTIFPTPEGQVYVSAMIADDKTGKYTGREVHRTIKMTDITNILSAYADDPENTLETLFSVDLCPIQEPDDRTLLAGLRNERSNVPPKKETIKDQLARLEI